jgi:hypothetical protein
MRASFEWHMDIKVLRPWTRTFYFLPQRVATRDDSGDAEGAWAGGEVGAIAEGHAESVVGGGGGAPPNNIRLVGSMLSIIVKFHVSLVVDDPLNE